ncbi:MAG TPA: hypothetical protein VGX22_00270 [Candidatus Dormibacteraeota bacterium]|nr:hypothetical protein [Candidatus Dormibacteraeota bacterium]
MYRYREIQQVVYGHWNDFVRAWQDLTAICKKKGWPEPSVWTPTVGAGNEAIVETDYRDLASFQAAYEAFQSDAEAMKVYRGLAGIVVQGSSRSELIERVTKPLA